MTGGQHSPTTLINDYTSTTPHGNIDPTFDICDLALGAGATFVARTTAFHVIEAQKIIKEAILHKGVSVVEIMSTCPVIYGKLNKKGSPSDMLRWLKENSITVTDAEKATPEKLEGKLIRGILRQVNKPEYCESYSKLIENLHNKEEAKK